MIRRSLAAAVAGVCALSLAACGYEPTPVPKPSAAPSSSAPAASSPTCSSKGATRSFAPNGALPSPGDMPSGSTMRKIQERGRLIAGVSADTYLLSSRNPLNGKIEGFDIDMVRAVAKAILGNPNKVQLKVITAADRIPVLQNHEVDIVVRNMTINCTRWQDIDFSAEYYLSGQKMLIRKGSRLSATFDRQRMCAPTGTSSLDNLRRDYPQSVAVPAVNHTGCLVLFQQGKVQAITGDDTVLAGLAAQDPYAEVPQQKAFTQEPYGIGIPQGETDMVRFVNGVLAKMRSDGEWERAYNTWLRPTLGKGTGQPRPEYGRTR